MFHELLRGLEVFHSDLQSTNPERYHIRPCFTLEGPEIGARTRKPLLLLIYPLWIPLLLCEDRVDLSQGERCVSSQRERR